MYLTPPANKNKKIREGAVVNGCLERHAIYLLAFYIEISTCTCNFVQKKMDNKGRK